MPGVHDARLAPLMIGCAPLPYAAYVIGCDAVPLCRGVNVSRHTSPLLKPTDWPGKSAVEFTLAMVFQGAARVPGFVSNPFVEST